tara:strand:+ start:15324 stop:19085 length:3762 start_codon:yes stop_codon:yes gene_type:complete
VIRFPMYVAAIAFHATSLLAQAATVPEISKPEISKTQISKTVPAKTVPANTVPAKPVSAATADAVLFARQYVGMRVPIADAPDQTAKTCLAFVDGHRDSVLTGWLVSRLLRERNFVQHPEAQLSTLAALLAKQDLHGQLRNQLQLYYYQMLRASGRAADAGKADPKNGHPREFLCVGPFGGDDDDFAGVPFAPELVPWPADSKFDGAAAQPRPVRIAVGNSSVVPTDPRDDRTGCFYVLNRVVAERDTQCYLMLWIRGVAEVFVNGVPVARVDEQLGDGRAQHELPIALAAGLNHVVVKTCQRDNNDFEFDYVDASWLPIQSLREIAASEPVMPAVAGIAATLPPLVDAIVVLRAAMAEAQGEDRQYLRVALGFVADYLLVRDDEFESVVDLQPADATLQLAAAQLWRSQGLVPEDRRNANARKLEEAAARQLNDEHYAMVRSAVGLLEEQDRREQALTRLWAVVAAGRAGPQTFRLLLGVASRAKFDSERARILRAWQKALPRDPRVYRELALDCRRGGATRRAAELAERAVRLRPDISNNLQLAYWPMIAAGEFDRVQELRELVFPAALADPTDLTSRILWDIGIAAARPDPTEWLQLTDQLLAHPRASGKRLRATADSLLRRGHLERAQRAYQAVLARDPDDMTVKRLLQRASGAPEPGDDFARFRRDGDAALAAFAADADAAGNSDSPATTLIDQRIVELFADGSRYEETHELRRLNDRDGIEMYGNADAPAAAEEVLLLRTIDAKGDEFVPVRIQKGYSMPRLQPGVFVEWRFRSPVPARDDGSMVVDDFLFGSFADNIVLAELIVIRPKGATMELRMRKFDKPTEIVDLGDGREALRFTRENLARLVPDTAMPALAEMVPVVVAGKDRTIGSTLRTAARRLATLTVSTPPIRRQVEKLLAGIDAPEAQLLALHTFCHEQIAAARSRSATETLLKRQGSRQQLLFAMLAVAGFDLRAALCQTAREELYAASGLLFQDASYYFTEWCVRVEKQGAPPTWLFYDAPRYSPPGWISPTRAGSAVLVHTEAGTEMSRLPRGEQRVQHLRISGLGQLTPKSLQVEAKLELLGDDAYRAAEHFLQQPAAAQKQFAQQFAQSLFQGWQVRSAELLPLKPGGTVAVTATLRRRGLQPDGGRTLLAMPLPEGNFLSAFGPRPERTMPMRLTSDVHMSWDLRLDLEGVQIASVPESLAIEHGPLVYLQELRRDGDSLVIKRRATMRPGLIPVPSLPVWSTTLERLKRAESQSLVFVVR